MRSIRVPKLVTEFGAILTEHGYQCWLVGGATRDIIRGAIPLDYDIATDALPEEVCAIYKRVIPTGIQHGTVTVLFKNIPFEVTTFRADGRYSDSRHPDKIEFKSDINEDLSRRDFTINAIACSVPSGLLLDPHEGIRDIKNRVIMAIGNPDDRFNEDSLRPLRAIRFSSQLGFLIEKNTFDAICRNFERIVIVASERIREEFNKILLSTKPSVGLRLLEQTGLLGRIIPELQECRGVMQGGFHDFDVLDHLFFSCDGAEAKLEIRLAALFHDIGKPQARFEDSTGIASFHMHEKYSAEITRKILKRLKYPNIIENDVCHLIFNHMFFYTDDWSDSAVRRFVARVGVEYLPRLFSLRFADQYGMKAITVDPEGITKLQDRINSIKAKDAALTIKDLMIGGNDLAEIGYTRGPVMGLVLKELLESVLDDPGLNDRTKLLEIATRMKETFTK